MKTYIDPQSNGKKSSQLVGKYGIIHGSYGILYLFYIVNLEEGIGSWMMLASFFLQACNCCSNFGVCYVFSKFQRIPRAKLPQRILATEGVSKKGFFNLHVYAFHQDPLSGTPLQNIACH